MSSTDTTPTVEPAVDQTAAEAWRQFIAQARVLGMAMEIVGRRREIVIYTGWTEGARGNRPLTESELTS